MNFSDEIAVCDESYVKLATEVDKLQGRKETLHGEMTKYKQLVTTLTAQENLYLKCADFLSKVQTGFQNKVKSSFEDVVTSALVSIFGAGYKFQIEISKSGNYQNVDFTVASPTLNMPFDPMDTSGGGVIDAMCLALRIMILEWYHPKIGGPILLDETFKHVSGGRVEFAGKFLTEISRKTKRQIILVTHQVALMDNADSQLRLE